MGDVVTIDVLISAPSLDAAANVSGISSLVTDLIAASKGKVNYAYLRLGAPQTGSWVRRRVESLLFIGKAVARVWRSPAPVFHSNTAFDIKSICRDLVLIAIAKARGKHVLLHVHGGRFVHESAPGFVSNLLAGLLRMADRTVFLSTTELEAFKARYPTYSRKMGSIYNSVDLDGSERFSAGTHDGEHLQVAFIGRLANTKGIDVLLTAARATYTPPVRFFVHGDGPLRDEVDEAVAANPHLTKAPLFSRVEWRNVLCRYDVLLLPSSSGEGMPMVILEAMTLGVVPITTAIASVPEVVKDGERGMLVPVHDSAAVIEAIASLNRDRPELARMRSACRSYAREKFDVRNSSMQFLNIYRELTGHNGACLDASGKPNLGERN
jgi:glycosyltransferase involved in cell wall biosynthesis